MHRSMVDYLVHTQKMDVRIVLHAFHYGLEVKISLFQSEESGALPDSGTI